MSDQKLKPEEIHKELDLIQGVITRMASNSFEVKKWLIGILTVLVVFDNTELLGGNLNLAWLLFLPILSFWYLDAFFLKAEKQYREMYKWVVKYRNETSEYLYDLNTFERTPPVLDKKNKKNNVPKVMFSKTLWPFYLIPFVFVLVYWLCPYVENFFN